MNLQYHATLIHLDNEISKQSITILQITLDYMELMAIAVHQAYHHNHHRRQDRNHKTCDNHQMTLDGLWSLPVPLIKLIITISHHCHHHYHHHHHHLCHHHLDHHHRDD